MSEILFWQANVANLPNLSTCQMCDIKCSNVWTVMFLYSSNNWTQIVQVPVFRQIKLNRQISLICQNNFGKSKMAVHNKIISVHQPSEFLNKGLMSYTSFWIKFEYVSILK